MTTLAVLMSEFFSKTLKSTQEFSNQYRKKSVFSKLTAQIRSAVSCKITVFYKSWYAKVSTDGCIINLMKGLGGS